MPPNYYTSQQCSVYIWSDLIHTNWWWWLSKGVVGMGWVCEGAEWHSHAAEPQVHQSTTVDCCQQSFAMIQARRRCFCGFYFVVLGSWPHSMSLTRPKVCLLFSASQAPQTLAISHNWLKIMKCYEEGRTNRWLLVAVASSFHSLPGELQWTLSLFSSLHLEKFPYIFFFLWFFVLNAIRNFCQYLFFGQPVSGSSNCSPPGQNPIFMGSDCSTSFHRRTQL